MSRYDLFQLTRPRGARLICVVGQGQLWGFNSRARVGRDPQGLLRLVAGQSFNSRARVGRDLGPLGNSIQSPAFQLTRPRGARRLLVLDNFVMSDVSTHAPAWGATMLHVLFPSCKRGFNSRARVGRDLE